MIKVYTKGSSEMLSKNFSVREFECKCSRCKETKVDTRLVEILQSVRDHFDVPVFITGPYRCPEHNAETPNASKTSLHMKGMAADISVSGVDPEEVAKYAESIGVLGIGLYDTDKDGHFVHLDTREYKSFWFGHAQAYRSTFGGAPAYDREQFIREVQKALGAPVTGKADLVTIGMTVAVSAKVNPKHAVVKPLQNRLNELGYAEVGTADGEAGPKFTSAVLHFQQDHGCTQTGALQDWDKTWHLLLWG